jgi:hypothetical protein
VTNYFWRVGDVGRQNIHRIIKGVEGEFSDRLRGMIYWLVKFPNSRFWRDGGRDDPGCLELKVRCIRDAGRWSRLCLKGNSKMKGV